MLNYRLMSIDDYEAVYDLWIKCGNGLDTEIDVTHFGSRFVPPYTAKI